MSDLGEAEERHIYDHLLQIYQFPSYVVVWRGDRSRGYRFTPTKDDWFYGYAPFDFIIYKNEDRNGNRILSELPPPGDQRRAKEDFRLLRENSVDDMVIEAKGRNFKDYTGVYINNHLPTGTDIDYEPYTNKVPTATTPENPEGKLNKIIKLYNENNNRPVYFLNKDKGKDVYYLNKLTLPTINKIKATGVWERNHNPVLAKEGKPNRWEKNYNIFWDFFTKWSDDNMTPLDQLFHSDGMPLEPVKRVYEAWRKKHLQSLVESFQEKSKVKAVNKFYASTIAPKTLSEYQPRNIDSAERREALFKEAMEKIPVEKRNTRNVDYNKIKAWYGKKVGS